MGKKVIIIVGAILLIDQIIKIWVKTSMVPNGSGAIPVIDGFFQLYYVENRGMAFGATLGGGSWAKYTLSLFRLVAIFGIGWYIHKLIRENQSPKGLIISIALVLAGAAGNLIDSLCYDLIFEVTTDEYWNVVRDSAGNYVFDPVTNGPMLRDHGFLLGSVVDMFQFTTVWPEWMPVINLNLPGFLGGGNILDIYPGKEIFGAIWNFADLAISVGVGLIIFRYRKFFRKGPAVSETDTDDSSQGLKESEVITAVDVNPPASSADN